jgi:transposase-like protein
MTELAAQLRQKKYSKSTQTIERSSQDIWNHRALPRVHWKKIRNTNRLEQINKKFKMGRRVIGAFPNGRAFLGLGVNG